MNSLRVFQESAKEIRKLVLLKTYPVAVKLLEKDGDIPEGVKRPVRDLGHHLALCQGFSMSRREGAYLRLFALERVTIRCPSAPSGLRPSGA